MVRFVFLFFSTFLIGCDSRSDFHNCLEIAKKSMPAENATVVCAKEHEEKLENSVIEDGDASWDSWKFKIDSLKVKPGYAITKLRVVAKRSSNDPGEKFVIGVFYLFGHPLMYFDQVVKTKGTPSQSEKNWGFQVEEVWGVNVYEK